MRRVLIATALAVAAAGALASATVGQAAPAFTVVDTVGKTVSLRLQTVTDRRRRRPRPDPDRHRLGSGLTQTGVRSKI